MRALFISLAIAIVLVWAGVQTYARYPMVATTFYTLSGVLVALGVVVFFGLN